MMKDDAAGVEKTAPTDQGALLQDLRRLRRTARRGRRQDGVKAMKTTFTRRDVLKGTGRARRHARFADAGPLLGGPRRPRRSRRR